MGSEGARKGHKGSGHSILDDFRAEGNGLAEYVLKNLYVYFWRWATWKVFDAIPENRAGVVCFITTSGYIGGPGFKGMREYLRRECSEGWVIDVSPEGIRPEVPTRIFPGVQRPLAIGIFVRRSGTLRDQPAKVRHTALNGLRVEKYKELSTLSIDKAEWRDTRTDWQAPFTPAADSTWDEHPALADMLPWAVAGVKPNRTWVYSPAAEILKSRWIKLVAETDPEEKKRLFRESRDATLSKVKQPLPGVGVHVFDGPFLVESGPPPPPIGVGYRSFDRQWLIPDNRLMHGPSPDLWAARVPGQVFLIEQHAHPISDGPGVMFSSLITDMDHFNNRGGRNRPMLHPDGTTNIAPHLTTAIANAINLQIDPSDVLAYIASTVAHPAFTQHFGVSMASRGSFL